MGLSSLRSTSIDGRSRFSDQWFHFGDCSVAVSEWVPLSMPRGTLIFVHGRFGSGEIWSPIIHELSRQFRCICVDLPGFGRSFSVENRGLSLMENANLLAQISEKLGAGSAILIGHDIGGAIVQLFSIQYPSRVEALVLINSTSISNEVPELPRSYRGWAIRWKLRRLLSQTECLDDERKEVLLRPWERSSSRVSMLRALEMFERSWPGPAERDIWKEALSEIQQPALVLWGSRDRLNPPDQGFELMRRLPEAYFLENEKAGHWPCLEEPEWVVAKVRDFVFRLFSARRPAPRHVHVRRH
jgi:pimeloyl-ACP methyl ester carboxylesterase